MPSSHWGKLRGVVHMIRIRKPVKFNAQRRRMAENLKLNYIRNHPTPSRMTNENNKKLFRQQRNINAWKWALNKAMAAPIKKSRPSSYRVVGGSALGTKKVTGGIRAMFSGKTKGRSYRPTTRSTK